MTIAGSETEQLKLESIISECKIYQVIFFIRSKKFGQAHEHKSLPISSLQVNF